MSFQRYLVLIGFLATANSALARSVADFHAETSKSSYSSSLDQPKGDSGRQIADSSQRTKNQDNSNIDKETRREERDLAREGKKTCEISYERRNGKKKKCELSIYEQALPGINFEATDEKVIDEMIRELRKDPRSQNSIIVR
ncbi:hypothetical protein ACQ4M3_01465 [Leptolyngbya sp. AN03gr2]